MAKKKNKNKNKGVIKEQPNVARKRRNYIVGGLLALVVAAAVIIAVTAGAGHKTAQNMTPNATQDYTVQTAKGNIVMEVYPKLMPITVANFAKLVNMGFYNGLTFHRVNDWLIQGGDPNGNGSGGPGWTIKFETNPHLKNVRGAVAMARLPQDLNSAGSQFYILKKDEPSLDGQYAVFGKVISGMSVVDRIAKGDKMISIKPGP